jgi:cell division control protein 6
MTDPPLFVPDTNLYKNRDAVKDSYTPTTIVGRDTEVEKYQTALQPVINGEEPDNIFIYGKTGVGKTAVTNYLLRELTNSAEQFDVALTILKINCEGSNTSYQAAIRLVNQLRNPQDHLSQAGHAEWKVYEAFWDELDAIGGTILIVLDEIDNIDDDRLLYQLSRARSDNNVEQCKLGVIGISNDLTYRDQLAAEVTSSLSEKSVFFPPYNATELEAVLQQRADIAFQEDALNDSVIRLCAAFGAQDAGDARKAISLLRETGDLARNESAERITDSHIRTAQQKLEIEEVVTGIEENLSENEQLVLYALTTLDAESDTPTRTRHIYERYCELAAVAGAREVSNRRIHDFLSDLEGLNIIDSTQRTGGPDGTYNEHMVIHDIEDVLRGLNELVDRVGVHTSVTQYVDQD